MESFMRDPLKQPGTLEMIMLTEVGYMKMTLSWIIAAAWQNQDILSLLEGVM